MPDIGPARTPDDDAQPTEDDQLDEAAAVPAPDGSATVDAASVIDEADEIEAIDGKPAIKEGKVSHEDQTRRYLAIGGMVLLAVLALAGAWGWLNRDMTTEEIQSFAVIFSPVVALLGPILGFYFSKK